jgi:hypothetical protein
MGLMEQKHGIIIFDFHSNGNLIPLCLMRDKEISYFLQIQRLILSLFPVPSPPKKSLKNFSFVLRSPRPQGRAFVHNLRTISHIQKGFSE